MKALSSLLLVLSICVAAVIPSTAADDKQLTNMKGDVTYQQGTAAAKPVAVNAHVSLSNNDYANTGANSQATITLPDSSQVLMGQNSQIQMLAFDQQPGLSTANFFLYKGKTRFVVKHPGGAKANYTFQTSTGQIAVRGTEGDISLDASTLQVNVYALGDPNLPVEVSLNNGKKYELHAGQALVVGITGAVIAAAAISSISSTMTSTFAEFGASNAGAAGGAGAGAAGAGAGAAGAAGAAVAPAAIAAGAAAVAAGAVVAGSTHSSPAPKKTPKPTPSPTAKPTSSPTPVPSPSPGAVVLNPPTTLALKKQGDVEPFSASQANTDNSFTIANDNPTAVTVTAGSAAGSYTAKELSPGTAHVTVTGADNKSAVLTINAGSGTIMPSSTSLTIQKAGATQPLTVSEKGYVGTFTVTSKNLKVASVTSGASARSASDASQAFTVMGVSAGTTTLTVKDGNGNVLSPPVGVSVLSGQISGVPANIKFNGLQQQQTFTPQETGYTGAFTARVTAGSKNASVSGPTGAGLFTVTSLGYGSATVQVSDSANNSVTVNVTVTKSPSPAPSTTCVPIIINGRRHGADAGATPCPVPSSTPTPIPTATPTPVPTATPPPRPHHPVQSQQPPSGPPARKPVKTDPRHLPTNPMHPMQPLTGPRGILTPPPMPSPPGGGK